LKDEKLAKEFEKFAAASWCLENLAFYRQVEVYRSLSSDKMAREARKMISNFVVLGSPCEINIEMKTRKEILEKQTEGIFDQNLFDVARKEVLLMLEHAVFPLWLSRFNKTNSSKNKKVSFIFQRYWLF